MHHNLHLKGVLAAALLWALASNPAPAQQPGTVAAKPVTGDAAVRAQESQGIPARPGPNDYQGNAKAGAITIAADFDQRGILTPNATYSSEDYVAVEVGIFGPAGKRLALNYQDFTLRINGKKAPYPAQPFLEVFKSLKDPSWSPPEQPEAEKSKTSFNTGGGNNSDPPPLPPKMPFELRRAMEQRVQKASLPEGDRALPQGGLLFFEYHGKAENLRSVALIYNGPAGKATIPLHP